MATTEPEGPAFRPSDIARRAFGSARKGLDPRAVREFLQGLSEHVARLEAQVEWQRARTEHLERQSGSAKDAAYSRLSRDFMEVVRAADDASSRVRAEAEAEARKTVASAHDEADEIVAAAKSEAEGVLAAAKSRAERIMAEATAAAAAQASTRAALENKIWSRPEPVAEPPEWFVSMPASPDVWEDPPVPPPPAPPHGPAEDLKGLDVHFDRSLFDLDDPAEGV